MKKINFTCPHCGGHKLIVEKPLQWIQLDVIGFDDDGDLLFDHDRPSIVDDDNDDFDIYCKDCYAQFSLEVIEEMVDIDCHEAQMTDIKIGDAVKFKEGSTIIPNDNVYKVVMASRSHACIFIPEVKTIVSIDINRLEPVNKGEQNDNRPNETTD